MELISELKIVHFSASKNPIPFYIFKFSSMVRNINEIKVVINQQTSINFFSKYSDFAKKKIDINSPST